jgi:hypothetical protein
MKINELQRIQQLAGLNEFTDPEGQFTAVAAPADPAPQRTYAVRLIGLPEKRMIGLPAELVWKALSGVLPREYPPGSAAQPGPAQVLVGKLVTTKQPQIIKRGLTKDVAETIEKRISNYHGGGVMSIPVDIVQE